MSDKSLWSSINPQLFHFPAACANAELALKQLYMRCVCLCHLLAVGQCQIYVLSHVPDRYLYVYERVYLHGEDPDQPEDEESVGTRGSKNGGRILVHQVPLRYHFKQHRVNPNSRAFHGLSTDMATLNAYERLEKSLISGTSCDQRHSLLCCPLPILRPFVS